MGKNNNFRIIIMQFSAIITLLGLASFAAACAGDSGCCCYDFKFAVPAASGSSISSAADATATTTSNEKTLWVKNGTTQAEIEEFIANN